MGPKVDQGRRFARDGVDTVVDIHGEGPPVLLLHGFPDTGDLWRHQIPALVAAGMQVIVPDLRGCGRSDRPEEVGSYAIWQLAADVTGILDELGLSSVSVVGHDLGAALAWYLAIFHPDRVERLAAFEVGHPLAFRSAGLEQLSRSWYIFFFQFVGVAEEWLRADNWANFRVWAGHPDAEGVIANIERHDSLTSSLNWYRANVTPDTLVAPPLELPSVTCPVLGVWCSGEFALTEEQMTHSARYVSGPWRYERIEELGHWFMLEAPDVANELLLDFLMAAR